MAGNKNLGTAKFEKNDEFYTQLTDIEKELRHYRKHFEGKTVLCNCDDPFESNFFKYFVLNFNRLGLKKLLATCYAGSPIANQQLSLFDVIGQGEENTNKPYKAIITTVYDKTGDGGVDMFDVAELFKSGENTLVELEGNGDFRSLECLELLDEADVVVTNPPFSLFREYITLLFEKGKHFIVMGTLNGCKYRETFPLIRDNQMWLGYYFNKTYEYKVPDDYDFVPGKFRVDEKGNHYIKVPGICWFTNLDLKKRHENLILVRKYSEENYPKYTNYDGIDVKNINDIPCDYSGIMGVPISFMGQYNPEQFEIIGLGEGDLAKEIGITRNHEGRTKVEYEENGEFIRPYARILVRNKQPEEVNK